MSLEDQRETGRGVRFAPSPTGIFHIGNLRTAWVSWRLAKMLGEPWILRIEDIDTERSTAAAAQRQLDDLNELGLRPDKVYRQKDRYKRHLDLFNQAQNGPSPPIYPCDCSRKEVLAALAAMQSAPHGPDASYSGYCRFRTNEALTPTESLSWRWASPTDQTGQHDAIVARTKGGSFIPGYHWACAVDDADGNYRLLVRAWDLEGAESVQSQIRRWVRPDNRSAVFHTTLISRDDGGRLEKRTLGITLKELLAAGWTTAKLLHCFKRSFNESAALSGNTTASGEPIRSMRLADLAI